MRIAVTSNYDDENFDELFVNNLPLIMSKEVAQSVCNLLNQIDPHGRNYYRVVENNYELQKREA